MSTEKCRDLSSGVAGETVIGIECDGSAVKDVAAVSVAASLILELPFSWLIGGDRASSDGALISVDGLPSIDSAAR